MQNSERVVEVVYPSTYALPFQRFIFGQGSLSGRVLHRSYAGGLLAKLTAKTEVSKAYVPWF